MLRTMTARAAVKPSPSSDLSGSSRHSEPNNGTTPKEDPLQPAQQPPKLKHKVVMNLIQANFTKIQREARGRRFRDVSKMLGEVSGVLEELSGLEAWPPPVKTEVPLPDWMKEHKSSDHEEKKGGEVKANGQEEEGEKKGDDAEEDVKKEADDKEEEGETKQVDKKKEVEDKKSENGAKSPMPKKSPKKPQPKKEIHPAIFPLLELYAVLLVHPYKTATLTEVCLDSILILISNNYILSSPSFMPKLLDSIVKCSESSTEAIQISMSKCLLALITHIQCDVHEASMLTAVRATFHVYLVSKSLNTKSVAKSTLLDMLKAVFNRMEAYDALPPEENSEDSIYNTDAYLLFRALCKLSAKPLPGDDGENLASSKLLSSFANAVDPMALQSKILSLELIKSVLDHAGKAFKTGKKFIYAIQNYLCVSLLKNCMSHDTTVVLLSLKIFLSLVYHFKTHLKSEIEVFVAHIFLRVLESANSSMEQKGLVLEALRALCSDPFILTQIFLNYDCDLDGLNLYKSIILHLTKLVKRKDGAAAEDQLAFDGLQILVVVLRTFLKALGLPGGDDASAPNRLLDVGLALQNDEIDSVVTTASDVKEGEAAKIVHAFDRKRDREQMFEIARVKFTLSLKSGLLYLIEHGFITCDAKSVALFFHERKENFDKTQMGEVLGKEPDAALIKDETDPEKGGPGFYVRILYHYVDAMDFTDMTFDDAIRSFLSGFRLPGEAQKIDRIMEKFAERYTRQNETIFHSADTAFILAFSVIMLNTDLHNPSIKPEKKMTCESFIRNNRGISVDGGDLPDEFLSGIFQRIQETPFSLKEDDDARAAADAKQQVIVDVSFFDNTLFGLSADDRKREKFKKEREEMMAASEHLFHKKKNRSKTTSNTDSVPPSDVVKPMFDVSWGAIIGTLSQILETTEDHGTITLCLNGFVYAIRISSHSQMSLARETFVNSLAKLTSLGFIKEMKYKNIECIRTLLSIAIIDGEFLEESWGPVLQCISQLARLQLSASRLAADDKFLTEDAEESKVESAFKFFRTATPAEIAKEMEESNGRVVLAAVNETLIDKVFSCTVKLSSLSIVHFIEQLINVSRSEIAGESKINISGVSQNQTIGSSSHKGGDGPRIFSLQRLVEVADYNMDVRPRIVWTQMWEMMAQHLATIGCHENAMVSIFAIDALRQLSFKFLVKPELSDFNFQRLFLRPFLVIISNKNSREDIRELVLRCVDNMIRLQSTNLRSGWKIVLECLTQSARDPCEKNACLGLAILQRLLDEHLDSLCRSPDPSSEGNEMTAVERRQRNATVEDFCGLCRASLAFVQVEELDTPMPIGLSMRALCHISCYADLIADEKVLPPMAHSQTNDPLAVGYTYPNLPTTAESEYMALWRPIMDGLAEGISSTARSNSGGVGCLVHRGSVMAMRAIFLRHGHLFTVNQWATLLEYVVLPSMQRAAEFDNFPLIAIVSDHPAVSNLDFLGEALPLPPNPEDEGLQKFAEQQAQSTEGGLKRPLGTAELLVEASFADLRHGGDGNLSRAYGLAAKKEQPKKNPHEQPFPDSWIATTAPIVLGMLTDILGEIFLKIGEPARQILWPILLRQYHCWVLGTPISTKETIHYTDDDISDIDDTSTYDWKPCEALVRIGCKELSRVTITLANASYLDAEEMRAWFHTIFTSIATTLAENAVLEVRLHEELLDLKMAVFGGDKMKAQDEEKEEVPRDIRTRTPYGAGELVGERVEAVGESEIIICKVKLDWGATLYGPDHNAEDDIKEEIAEEAKEQDVQDTKDEENSSSDHIIQAPNSLSRENYLERFIPALKIRCVSAYLIQQYLPQILNALADLMGKEEAIVLLAALDDSRLMAKKAIQDADLSHAFQEFVRSDWGDGVEEVEQQMAIIGGASSYRHHVGSEMFFLTQEAGSNKAICHLLSILYCRPNSTELFWDARSYAGPLYIDVTKDILTTFLESEKSEGRTLDANVWRRPSESLNKTPMYCTTFAGVVVSILFTFLKFHPDQFKTHLQDIFPLLTKLISVSSDEIRQLVGEIMEQQVAPLLGVRLTVDNV